MYIIYESPRWYCAYLELVFDLGETGETISGGKDVQVEGQATYQSAKLTSFMHECLPYESDDRFDTVGRGNSRKFHVSE